MTVPPVPPVPLVLVSGYTGSGKSSLAEAVAQTIGASTVSFDWVMSALRSFPEVWGVVETPVERQRSVGWTLMARVAEQQLRAGRSVVLDLVARSATLDLWADVAERNGAKVVVLECVCSDAEVHRSRVVGRVRDIPGWYELSVADVERSRAAYQPLPGPKLVVDAVDLLDANVRAALDFIEQVRKSDDDEFGGVL